MTLSNLLNTFKFQSIEFEDLDLIEQQMKMVADHVKRLRGEIDFLEEKGTVGIDMDSTISLDANADKVFDVLSEDKNQIRGSPNGPMTYSKILGASKWGDVDDAAPGSPRTWSKVVVKSPSLAAQGMQLDFITPEVREGIMVAKLQRDDALKMEEQWEFVVMAFVVAVKPLNYHFQRYV